MKAEIKEYEGSYIVMLRAETMQEGAAMTRLAMNKTKAVTASVVVTRDGDFITEVDFNKHPNWTQVIPSAH